MNFKRIYLMDLIVLFIFSCFIIQNFPYNDPNILKEIGIVLGYILLRYLNYSLHRIVACWYAYAFFLSSIGIFIDGSSINGVLAAMLGLLFLTAPDEIEVQIVTFLFISFITACGVFWIFEDETLFAKIHFSIFFWLPVVISCYDKIMFQIKEE